MPEEKKAPRRPRKRRKPETVQEAPPSPTTQVTRERSPDGQNR